MRKYEWRIKSCIILFITKLITVQCCFCGMGAQCCYWQSPQCERGYSAGSDCCAFDFPNCGGCASRNSCSQCQSEQYCLNNGECETCDEFLSNCQTCSDCMTCITCKSNTYAVNSSSLCQLCSQMLPNCLTCSSSTVCDTCASDDFTINNSTFRCQLCNATLNYCQRCSALDQCIQCVSHQNITMGPAHKCEYCIDLIDHCITCSSSNTCTLCKKYFTIAIIGASVVCQLCSNIMHGCSQCINDNICNRCGLGVIVQNGCSTIPGCESVLKSRSSSICKKCNSSQFYPQPTLIGTCLCVKGHLAGKHCTEMAGCTNILKNTADETCTSCHASENFFLQNGRCYCKEYYQLANGKCTDICGDGVVITLARDDGNHINGDGCSSQCTIEDGYNCRVQPGQTSSSCVYEGGLIRLQLVCVYKYQQINTARVILKLNPTINNFFRSDAQNQIHYQSSSNSSMSHYELSYSQIILFIIFSQNMQGKYGQITLDYDKQFIKSPKSKIVFPFIECNGDYLNYLPQTESNYKDEITLIVKIISILVLVIWLLGSYSHKMIGIQTLHVFQIIIISQSFAQYYQPIIAYFHDIHNVLGIYKDLVISSYSIVNRIEFIRLSYGADFVSNMAVIIGFNSIILLIFFSLEIINKYFKQKGKYAITLKKINSFRLKMYDYFLFPIYIGFSFSFLVSLTIYCHRNYIKFYSYYLQSFMAVFTVASTCYVYFDQWKYAFISQQNPKRPLSCKKSYVPIYLTYTCFMCFIIEFTLAKFLPYNIEIFAISQVIYTIFLLLYRPYISKLHNISLIVYQIGMLSNLSWLLSQKYYPQFRSKQELFAIALISQLCLIILISLIRIIYELRQPKIQIQESITSNGCNIREDEKQKSIENEESVSRSIELIQERQKYAIPFLNNLHFTNSRFKKVQTNRQNSQLHQFIRSRLRLKQYINNQNMDNNERFHQYNSPLNEVLIV